MSKYIDLDSRECVHLLCNLDPKWKPMPDVNKEDLKQLESIIEAFHALPSADVQKIRHGKWCWALSGSGQCSICKKRTPAFSYTPIYCPNCGAKMDGDENG